MRQTFTILLALMLTSTFAWSQGKGAGKALYEQSGDIAIGKGMVSNETFGWIGMDIAYTAEDFTVPAGETWSVYGVKAYLNGNEPSWAKIRIFEDDGGKPSMTTLELVNAENLVVTEIAFELWEIKFDLAIPHDFSEGKHWISVYTDAYGTWAFTQEAGVRGDKPHRLNVSGRYMEYSSAEWLPVIDGPSNDNGTYYNMALSLLGPPADNDLAANALINPVNGDLDDATVIEAEIKNEGLLTQTSFSVMYQVSATIDGEVVSIAKETENVSGVSIAAGNTYTHTFAETADLSVITTYEISTTVILTGDANETNDEFLSVIKNYGPLYTMGIDKEVTTCSGIFVDDGGVNNPYGEGMFDTITFTPGADGKRISLEFTTLDVNWNSPKTWTFYDGPTVDDNILVQYSRLNSSWPEKLSGSKITARNPEGIMTVVITRNQVNPGIGWEANVNCETPNAIEFEALELQIGSGAEMLNHNSPVNVRAIVTNAGADTVARKVYIIEDGIVIETLMTSVLVPGVFDTVNYEWTPSFVTDNMNIEVRIENDPQETNNDNSLETTVQVFANGLFTENFEIDGFESSSYDSKEALPIHWYSLVNNTDYTYNYFKQDAAYSTDGNFSLRLKEDTVIMPLMQAREGDKLSLDIDLDWKTRFFEILYSENIDGPWMVLDTAHYGTGQFERFEFELSELTDTAYYFALAYDSYCYVDRVLGAPLYKYDYDMMAYEFEATDRITAEKETIVSFSVKNNGLMDLKSSDYKFEIRDADSVYFTVSGISLMSMETGMLNVPISFKTADTLELYAQPVLEGELRLNNNITNPETVIILDKDEYIFSAGDFHGTTYYPFYFGYGTDWDWNVDPAVQFNYDRKYGITETVYYPNEVGGNGELTALEYTYKWYNSDVSVDSVPITIHLATAVDSFLVDTSKKVDGLHPITWVDTDSLNFVKVFDGMVEFKEGKEDKTLRINFDVPFNYNGTDNLIVLVDRDSMTYDQYPEIRTIKNLDNNGEHTYAQYRHLYGFNKRLPHDNIDPSDIVVEKENCDNSSAPHFNFYFNNSGAPVFESTPVVQAFEFEDYSYDIEVAYEGTGYSIEAVTMPEWMTLTSVSDTTATLTATAIDTVGVFPIQLMVTDGTYSEKQTFSVRVYGVPVFTTTATEIVESGIDYTYEIAVDYNGVGVTEFVGTIMPAWLTLTDNGNNTALLSGNTTVMGDHNVSIDVNGAGASVNQAFVINVGSYPVFDLEDVVTEDAMNYMETIEVEYSGTGTLTISAGDNFPTWLTLVDNGDKTATLTADAADVVVGVYDIDLVASDGAFETMGSYTITVGAVPVVTSTPETTGSTLVNYNYDFTTTYNGVDDVMISADVPEWMTFVDNGDGTANFSGMPAADGIYTVSILVSGEYFFTTSGSYSINVITVGVNDNSEIEFNMYPNPATNWFTLSGVENSTVEVISITGQVMFTQAVVNSTEKVNVSELNSGVYLVKVVTANGIAIKRLTIE